MHIVGTDGSKYCPSVATIRKPEFIEGVQGRNGVLVSFNLCNVRDAVYFQFTRLNLLHREYKRQMNEKVEEAGQELGSS